MKTPEISVIIPTFNRPKLLKRATESVLAQTFQDFEIIVIDDGSTISPLPVLSALGDNRIRYLRQENRGLSAARNTGIIEARGGFIAFLDDDDEFLPDKLRIQLALLLTDSELGAVMGGHIIVDEDGNELGEVRNWTNLDPNDIRTWLFGNPIVPCSLLIKKEWLGRIDGFDENQKFNEDTDFMLRLCYAGCRMAFDSELCGRYFVNKDGLSRNQQGMRQGILQTLGKFFAQPDIPEDLIALKSLAYTKAYITCAIRAFSTGTIPIAQEDLSAALQYEPNLPQNPSPVLETLINLALAPNITDDPIRLVDMFFNNLPPSARELKRYHREARESIHFHLLYEAREDEDRKRILEETIHLIANNPKNFWHRNIISSWAIILLSKNKKDRILSYVRRNESP